VNNVYVNSRNHGFDPYAFIEQISSRHVHEIHLAGHSVNRHGDREILIDTHSSPVCAQVWDLYAATIARFGRVPTLIEWDANLPDLDILVAEAARARVYLERIHGLAA